MRHRVRILSAAAVAGAAGLLSGAAARGDTVVLRSGKKLEGVVVSRDDAEGVVVNPWNSRHPDMRWEIPDKDRIPRDKVAEVVYGDAPLVEYRRRTSLPRASADDHVELAAFCETHKLKEEREREIRLALALDPANERAVALAGGPEKAARLAKGDPELDAELRELEREYVQLTEPEQLAAQWARMRELGTKRPREVLERARRSARLAKGTREKVPLTLRSEAAPGATYCIHVPQSYDPLVPTGLVVALHGGGRGGADPTLVTGSGEEALPFYLDVSEEWGVIVVCPTALAAPWSEQKNEAWLDALLDEMRALYHVDENRIWLTGHSMGGFGTWYWGPKRAEVWAAISPCAGGGGPAGVDTAGLPTYIYHGSDDNVVGVGSDRSAAKALAGGKKPFDFVYTEFDGVGHGFPDWVRKDIFRFFAGRWKDRGKKRATGPLSSFERKATKDEIRAFGDPAAVPEVSDDSGDAAVKDLIAALERGGGGGRDAAAALGAQKDPKVAKSVAKLLRSKKTTADTRVLACEALGAMALPDCVKYLDGALDDEDYRVTEAAVVALGANPAPDAAAALARGVRRLGARFEGSIQGDAIVFREYEVRLGSLAVALRACAGSKDVATLLPVVRSVVVEGALHRSLALEVVGENDPRFKDNPSQARLVLGRALRELLLAWGDTDGRALLEKVRDDWKDRQPGLAAEMDAALRDFP